MKRRLFNSIIVLMVLMVGTQWVTQAEEGDELIWGSGTVVSVDAKKSAVVLSVYDDQTEEYVDSTFMVDAKAKIGKGQKISDLKSGDAVDFEYEEVKGKNVIKILDFESEEDDVEMIEGE